MAEKAARKEFMSMYTKKKKEIEGGRHMIGDR